LVHLLKESMPAPNGELASFPIEGLGIIAIFQE
jgi:hypothetical protein